MTNRFNGLNSSAKRYTTSFSLAMILRWFQQARLVKVQALRWIGSDTSPVYALIGAQNSPNTGFGPHANGPSKASNAQASGISPLILKSAGRSRWMAAVLAAMFLMTTAAVALAAKKAQFAGLTIQYEPAQGCQLPEILARSNASFWVVRVDPKASRKLDLLNLLPSCSSLIAFENRTYDRTS